MNGKDIKLKEDKERKRNYMEWKIKEGMKNKEMEKNGEEREGAEGQ